jgi:hypothetical protein
VGHPISELIEAGLPAIDLGVLSHGFAPHGRDYVFIVEDAVGPNPGTFQLTFTHVVEFFYETRVRDDVWPRSWGEEFVDYAAWEAAGEPDGYVFGSHFSLAYPGISVPDQSPKAEAWSTRLGRPVHAVSIETDRFFISIVFSEARLRRLSNEAPTASKLIVPIP